MRLDLVDRYGPARDTAGAGGVVRRSSFFVRPQEQVARPGERVCELLLYLFGPAAVVTSSWRPPGMTTPYVHEFGSLHPVAA